MVDQKLNWKALAASFGVTWAIFVFLLGLSAALLDWGTSFVNLMSSIYMGYAPTVVGSFIGIPWALLDGFIAGALIALLYNYFKEAFEP